ncbi:MAG: type II toxin-antitoxin system VapC family toxin [Anaerolineae bacterium]|nr:type II toxin-antitoxin system VapC family toxin [Anaerolineae bacterium]
MNVVVDSNILIAVHLIDEPLHSKAQHILAYWHTKNISLVAPHLFKSEVTAVVRKAVYLNRVSHQRGQIILDEILNYPILYYEDEALLKRAFELAYEFNRPRAYDAQYLALAERLTCDFWTLDENFINVVKHKLKFVYWLGNWSNKI